MPVLLVVAAGVGWLALDTALRWGVAAQIVMLGIVGTAAVRQTTWSWWVKAALGKVI